MADFTFTENGWEHYLYWQTQNPKAIKKMNKLIADVKRNGPLKGIGKPEPLKHDMSGLYSRHIDDFNRLIYGFDDSQNMRIVSCKGHYKD